MERVQSNQTNMLWWNIIALLCCVFTLSFARTTFRAFWYQRTADEDYVLRVYGVLFVVVIFLLAFDVIV